HYAYAFVLMMRAAGLPARVVAGYQGGEVNPVNKTVIVHQFDAHAWAEVWLPQEGWRRVDPTAAVSPLRIEGGLEQAMLEEGSFLSESPLSAVRYRKIALINMLRLRYDALTYRWQSWVVSFDNQRQLDLLHNLFGEISARVFIAVFLGTWAIVLIPVAIGLLRRGAVHPLRPVDAHYLAFCRRLEAVGIVRQAGETPAQFALRVRGVRPDLAAQMAHITDLYNRQSYLPPGAVTGDTADELERAVKAFRPRRGGAARSLQPAPGGA
ncbi:MAG: transglutaminase domain-containing protein, partial [Halioglobus sp.]|nr:transglutaminase domain-containing protein [Halioglobus sp.]